MSNEISIFLKITIQKYKKTWETCMSFNNSIRVTEHILHTSSETATFLKITVQKYKQTVETCMVFE